MPLLIVFIVIPLIEIGLFIQVGGWIGLWPTLAIVVATAILGSWLVRSQGAAELANIKRSFREMSDPTGPLASGAMILFSGALLLTPGFFTDAVGFALLIPMVRRAVYDRLRDRVKVTGFHSADRSGPRREPDRRDPNTIDGEYEDVTDQAPRQSAPSGWTRDDG